MYPYHRDINGVQGLHSSAATVLQHLQPVRRILVSQCFPNRWETSIAMGSGAGFLVTVVLGAGPCPCITVAATLPLAGFLRSSPAVSVCVCLSLSVCLCVPLLSPAVPTVSLLLCARYIFIIIRVINRFVGIPIHGTVNLDASCIEHLPVVALLDVSDPLRDGLWIKRAC